MWLVKAPKYKRPLSLTLSQFLISSYLTKKKTIKLRINYPMILIEIIFSIVMPFSESFHGAFIVQSWSTFFIRAFSSELLMKNCPI